MQNISLKNIIWKEGNFYIAQCLNVDVNSFGDTRDEALKNLQEAVALYLEDADDKNINEVEQPEIVSTYFGHA
ncbi:MAG TPA: type II toxin-antitoxin system HicB family antitoxin [Ferruginibacter sp.]|nr:type II toxin-antitoxin system HicB family antitoxin [Ferruginibacter sp.]